MPINQEKEFNYPEYPALALCTLIEARLSSRKAIAKDIASTGLFEEIVEAKYVDEGIGLMALRQVDACFLGMYISAQRRIEFIQKVRGQSHLNDCAIIAIVAAEDHESVKSLSEAGVDGIIYSPYSKRELCDGIIKAVVKANADGLWAGIALSSLSNQLYSVDKLLETEEQRMILSIARKATTVLRDLVEGWRLQQYNLDPYGEPDEQTEKAIDHVVAELISEHRQNAAAEKLERRLKSSLMEWFVELTITNPKIAEQNLIKKIKSVSASLIKCNN